MVGRPTHLGPGEKGGFSLGSFQHRENHAETNPASGSRLGVRMQQHAHGRMLQNHLPPSPPPPPTIGLQVKRAGGILPFPGYLSQSYVPTPVA